MGKNTTTNGYMDDLNPSDGQRKQMAQANADDRKTSHKKYTVLQCRVSYEDRQTIEKYVRREGMSGISQFVRKAVFDYLEKLGA